MVSQNVDGLHLRSGVPRDKLAELHGNCFAERCPSCKKEYIRDFEMRLYAAFPCHELASCHASVAYLIIYCAFSAAWRQGTEGARSSLPECNASEEDQVGFKRTGRKCSMPGCKGRLKDFILGLGGCPARDELVASEEAASAADLAICLGTSLQITPACDLPLRTPRQASSSEPWLWEPRLQLPARTVKPMQHRHRTAHPSLWPVSG